MTGVVNWLILITNRDCAEPFAKCLSESGARLALAAPARGTVPESVLTYLGIERTDKMLLMALTDAKESRAFLRACERDMDIRLPGRGIALTVPVSSAGRSLIGTRETPREAEGEENRMPYEMVLVVAEPGCSDMVMDAAREHGATGGTVLRVRGTDEKGAEHFFGISIASEKELIMIVVPSDTRADVMRAILTKAGADTPAKAVAFSVPVTAAAGLHREKA